MRLVVKDFGGIRQADIQLDGITVVAGENSTGKSLIGKTLSFLTDVPSLACGQHEFLIQHFKSLFGNDSLLKTSGVRISLHTVKDVVTCESNRDKDSGEWFCYESTIIGDAGWPYRCIFISGADNLQGVYGRSKQSARKLHPVLYEILERVVAGEFVFNENGLCFERNGMDPIPVRFLPSGIRPFLFIKGLIECADLDEHVFLVLDGLETSLHPKWQVDFAELIVLLQKEFHLRVMLTTQSPYFLNAIEVFTIKHGIDDKISYYLASQETGITFKNVTDNVELIYRELAEPFQKLENVL